MLKKIALTLGATAVVTATSSAMFVHSASAAVGHHRILGKA